MTRSLHATVSEIFLLGGARAGSAVLERKTAAMLALLAFEQSASRARVSSLLWPAASEKTSRANLRQLLKRLRSVAGALVEGSQALHLRKGVTVDALGSHAQLENGSELLAGHEYDDCPEFADWLLVQRERSRSAVGAALTSASQRCEREGQLSLALDYAQRLVHAQPESENAHRMVIRLAHLMGDRAAALRAFEVCQQSVRRLCDAEVSAETRALSEAIRANGEVPSVRPAARREIPLGVQRPPVLVGRERAWAKMEEAWDSGRMIYVGGEAGTGKTRLINDFATTKGEFLVSQSLPGDATVPHAVQGRIFTRYRARYATRVSPAVLRTLARIAPALGKPGRRAASAAGERSRLQDALFVAYSFLHEGAACSLFDDAHNADHESFEDGGVVVARNHELAPEQRMRTIIAFRASELPAPMLDLIRGQAEQGIASLIELESLSQAEVAAMLASMGLEGFCAAAPLVYQRTGGNPLFVVELAKSLVEAGYLSTEAVAALPPSERVSRILERRLERLSLGAVHLLRVVAVVKDDFSPEVAAAILELPLSTILEQWSELAAAHMVRGNWFVHDLLYEQIARSTPTEVAQVLHRQAARLLDPAKVSRARIADHRRRGTRSRQLSATRP